MSDQKVSIYTFKNMSMHDLKFLAEKNNIKTIDKKKNRSKNDLINDLLKILDKKDNDKNIDSKTTNTQLMSSDITYIHGPIRIVKMESKKYDKKIYLFGDFHKKQSTCDKNPGLDVLLKCLLKENQDKIFDVFIEFPYSKNEKGTITDSYMKNVWNSFDNCNKIKKDKCEYKNLRLHYSDIRHYPYSDYFSIIIWINYKLNQTTEQTLENTLTKNSNNITKQLHIRNQLNLLSKDIEEFKKDNPNLFKENINLDNILRGSRSIKELLSLENKDVKEQLKLFVKNNSKYEIEWKDITNPTELSDNINKLRYLCMIVADVYVIARIFKDSLKTKNVFVYFGDLHISNYINILEKLGFTSQSESNGSNHNNIEKWPIRQCLNLSTFQPFKII